VVKVWEAATGKVVLSLKGHSRPVVSMAFSLDGKRLASASMDGTVKVWEKVTGQEILFLRAEGVQSVAFSPDSRCLATACNDGSVKVWEGVTPPAAVRLEREALALLDDLFTALVRRPAVLAYLRQEAMLDEALRQAALAAAEQFRPNPVRLAQASRLMVHRSHAGAAAYRRALLQAQEACRLVVGNGFFLNTLGVAQYRVGQYQVAVETLMQADQLNTAQFKLSYPGDLAFLAMAHYQLGQKDKALSALKRLRQVMTHPRWSRNGRAPGFLREAEALLEGQTGKQTEKPKR
jgi:tetratricopeptide (TPR) repeat protein